jgi:hypothetical protein
MGPDRLSRNVREGLPLYAAYYPRKVQISDAQLLPKIHVALPDPQTALPFVTIVHYNTLLSLRTRKLSLNTATSYLLPYAV